MRLSRKLMKHRRGISLLEVLVSIGVTSVGLLGVLALIPLGGAQARQGQVAERAPVIGLSAFGEIRNRDMLSPNNWLTAAGAQPTAGAYPVSFCLDPLSIATNAGNTDTAANFPQLATATYRMSRLTLNDGVAPDPKMSLAMAKSIFSSSDDLRVAFQTSTNNTVPLVERPNDRSLPPQQVWNTTMVPNDGSVRRQASETMSWMATVHPNWAMANPSDSYTVSVIVFNRRIVDTSLITEFTGTVSSFPGAGVSGGDVIVDFKNTDYTAKQMEDLKVPENSWLMLGGRAQVTYQGTPINVDLYQWYRVIASVRTGTHQMELTLSGPDWNKDIPTEATIIPGTVAVFQRNMQLESSTLWRN